MRKTSKIRLIRFETHGIRNLSHPISILFQKNLSLTDDADAHDRVRAVYGPNGSGKTSLVLSLWLLESLFNQHGFISRCGYDLLENLLNQSDPRYGIRLVFSVSDGQTPPRYFEYALEAELKNGSFALSKERFDLVRGRSLSSLSHEPIFSVEGGILKAYATDGDPEFRSHIMNATANLLSSTPFPRLFMGAVCDENIKRFNHYFDNVNRRAGYDRCLHNLIEFLSRLSTYLDSDDKHWERSADSLVQWEELSENIRGGEKAFASPLKPYNDYSVRLPRAEIDKYKDYIKRQAAFIRLFKPSLRDIEIRERLEGDYVRCHSIFIYDDAQLDFAFESTGIKKLANLFSCLERAANGGIVFVDELDANIAGACLTQLVRFMNEYGQGQLLFTAHAIDPMDALAEKSKAIYFIGEDNEVTAWTKNGTKKPQILYPRGFVPGIPFNMEPFDFLSSLLKEGD